ncbi:MAG: PAS domain-containing protein [Legionellales bacterium]|nr:PAS domain-containing protein [Legionellales bacterium]
MIPQRLISHIQSIFEYSPDLVYIKDKNLCYSYTNFTCLLRHERAQEEVITKLDTELHFAKYADAYNAHDLDAMREKIYYQLDATCTHTGNEIYALTQKLPLKDELGKVHGVLALTQLLNFEDVVHTVFSTNSRYRDNIKIAVDKRIFFNIESELSSRELEILYYFLQGKSTKTSAQVLDITERTVIFHLNNIKNKWECNSKESIFNKAKQKGLIELSALWNMLL